MEKIKQLRMVPHEKQDDQMENWERQAKIIENLKGGEMEQGDRYSIVDPVIRQEKTQELEKMMIELEFRQKQMTKLLNLKEAMSSKQFLTQEEQRVKGKYQVALSSLLGFHTDTLNATNELQTSLNATLKESKTVEKRIQIQGPRLQQLKDETGFLVGRIESEEQDTKVLEQLSDKRSELQFLK